MKKPILLAAALAASCVAPAARAQSTFPDVPDNHWAAQAVRRLAEAGIVEGYPAAPERAAPARAAAPTAEAIAQAPHAPADAKAAATADTKTVARRAAGAVRRAASAVTASTDRVAAR